MCPDGAESRDGNDNPPIVISGTGDANVRTGTAFDFPDTVLEGRLGNLLNGAKGSSQTAAVVRGQQRR